MEIPSHPSGETERDPLLGQARRSPNTNRARPTLSKLASRRRSSRQMRRIREIQNEQSVLKSVFPQEGGGAVGRGNRDAPQFSSHVDSTQRSGSQRTHKHSFLFSMLNAQSHSLQAHIFKTFIGMVILVDLVLFIISNSQKIDMPYAEGIVSTIFCIEYVLRLVTIVESRKYSHPFWGRLAYMRTWSAVVDLLATLPWFVELFSGWDLPTLTYLRFFRLIRILKTEGYARAMDTVYRVVYYNAEILYVASLLCIYLVLFTAVLLYYFRPANTSSATADSQFNSIASTMYLSALILTGQGGPDEEGLPWYTRAIVLMTSVFCKWLVAFWRCVCCKCTYETHHCTSVSQLFPCSLFLHPC